MSNVTSIDCDVEALTAALEQIGERCVRGVSAMMVEEAEKICDKARSNAPVDTGGLENAIDFKDTRTGLHGRTEVKIFVDLNALNDEGRTVGDYAVKMHEELAPYGSGFYKLGKKSREKAAEGHDVGGKYLERAVEERRQIIYYRAKKLAEKATKA